MDGSRILLLHDGDLSQNLAYNDLTRSGKKQVSALSFLGWFGTSFPEGQRVRLSWMKREPLRDKACATPTALNSPFEGILLSGNVFADHRKVMCGEHSSIFLYILVGFPFSYKRCLWLIYPDPSFIFRNVVQKQGYSRHNSLRRMFGFR